MRLRRIGHIAAGWMLVALLAACGGAPAASTTALSPAQQKLQQAQHATLRDTTFAIDFTADTAHNVGMGTLTTKPVRFALDLKRTTPAIKMVQLNVIGDGVANDIFLYSRLNNGGLWSTLNDGADGYFVNFDTDILNYDQLSAANLIGAETKDGQSTWHIHAIVTSQLYALDGTLIAAKGGEDLWLRQADAFPVEIDKSMTGSGTATDGTTAMVSLTATYRFTNWNTGATVQLPDPSQIAASG